MINNSGFRCYGLRRAASQRLPLALVLLASAVATILAAAPAATAAEGRLQGSISFNRSFDETHVGGSVSERLARDDHWTITLPDQATQNPNSIAPSEVYDATITGSISFQASAHCDSCIPQSHNAQGSWSGSGRVQLFIEPVYTVGNEPDHWRISVGAGGLRGSQSGDAQTPSSAPMAPRVLATFMPGEATSRSAAVCLDCMINRVRYAGVPEMPQETTTVPIDTSKLMLREKADVAVSVSEATEADDAGVVTTVAGSSTGVPIPRSRCGSTTCSRRTACSSSATPSRGACRTAGRSGPATSVALR